MGKRYVDYDELMSAMYHEAFENDDFYNEDDPDSSLCPIGHCWWDYIPEEDFICQST